MKSGIKSMGLRAWATTDSPSALACHGARLQAETVVSVVSVEQHAVAQSHAGKSWQSASAAFHCKESSMPTMPTSMSVVHMPIYAALLALLYVYLSVRTIGVRRRVQVALGAGENPEMLRAMRVHANFAEYVPLALILIYLVEAQGTAAWLVHALGVALLLGRCLHAYGVSQVKETFFFRVSGMVLTFNVLGVSAGLILAHTLLGLG
jgi:uncharacterized membrane protein YecN with MAPEG domain